MPKPFIEDRATLAPSKCVISGAGDGPIINTGRDYRDGPPRGRIYVAPSSIAHLLRDLGWLDPKEARDLHDDLLEQEAIIAEQEDELRRLRPLGKAVEGLIDTPEPEVREIEVQRPPTPQEIADYIAEHDPDPDAPEPGTTAEWYALYGPKGPQTPAQRAASDAEKRRAAARAQRSVDAASVNPAVDAEPAGENDETAPPRTVTLHGQDVDLDDLLDGTVKEVTSFIDGHPAEFQQAVANREIWRAEQAGKDPRVTILSAVADGTEEDGDE